ncbi:MAG: hypothetical protein HQ582_07675 [Planctomycetes bacterium]|nr:hypothetical protein [Planctomycetota bacterium]
MAFREAFLQILLTSRAYFRQLFGPQSVGWIEFNVRKSNTLPLRLWTNGADRVFLTLSRKTQLEPPLKGGARHMFGLPHELGHIVMYRSLVNLRELPEGWGEGWATYVASFLAVPHVYAKFGPDLWPYSYNYLETEGPDCCLRRFESVDRGEQNPTLRVVRDLYSLERRMGRRGFARFFRQLLSKPVRSTEFCRAVIEELKRATP